MHKRSRFAEISFVSQARRQPDYSLQQSLYDIVFQNLAETEPWDTE